MAITGTISTGNGSRREGVLVVTTTTFVLATVFVVARLVSRFGIVKNNTWDDWFIILAWVRLRLLGDILN
jgi:hypothetical protein